MIFGVQRAHLIFMGDPRIEWCSRITFARSNLARFLYRGDKIWQKPIKHKGQEKSQIQAKTKNWGLWTDTTNPHWLYTTALGSHHKINICIFYLQYFPLFFFITGTWTIWGNTVHKLDIVVWNLNDCSHSSWWKEQKLSSQDAVGTVILLLRE